MLFPDASSKNPQQHQEESYEALVPLPPALPQGEHSRALFKMLEATFDLLVPMVVADIIKVGIAGGDTTYIWTRCGLLVLMALIGLLCSFTAQYFARAPPSAHPPGCGMS